MSNWLSIAILSIKAKYFLNDLNIKHMSNQNEEVKPKISSHEFYFETPLYESISKSDFEKDIHNGDVDAYSAKNGIDTTYKIYSREVNGQYDSAFPDVYRITLTCKRKDDDVLRFFVFDNDEVVVKLGQYPSLADIQFAEIGKKYDKVLPKEDLKNFKKAIGLVYHGAGAGSFVYLRRIFEKLIFEAYENNAKAIAVSEEDFKKQRMMDRVETLKEFLPSQLVEMKGVYSVLSKGVHELTEDECLRYFSPIKLTIELILDQKIEEAKKQEKDAAVKKQLQQIQQEIATDKKNEE
jgi:hypothetical protein